MAVRATVPRTAALVGVLLLIGGCGGEGEDPARTGLEGRGEITFATGKDTSGNMQKLVAQWNAEHADEQVRVIELPESADAQRQQMVQNAQVKSGVYSVLKLDMVWTAEFAAHRWITELPRDRLDLDKFLPPTVTTAEYRDKLYAVPVYSDGGLLYYRKDLLDQVGVAVPTTWAGITDACAKVHALPEAAGIGCYAGQFEKYEGLTVNFGEAVHSAGGTIVDEKGKPTVNTPQAKAGLDILVRGFREGTIPGKAITFTEEEGRRAFQAGELLFHRQWTYQWSLANKTDGSSQVAGKFGVASLPGVGGPGSSTLGGHNLAVSSFARNKASAMDFITFFTSERVQRSNLVANSLPPTRAALYDDPELTAKFGYLPTLKATTLGATPRPSAVRYGDVSTAIQQAVYAALTNEKTSETALAELQTRLEELTR